MTGGPGRGGWFWRCALDALDEGRAAGDGQSDMACWGGCKLL